MMHLNEETAKPVKQKNLYDAPVLMGRELDQFLKMHPEVMNTCRMEFLKLFPGHKISFDVYQH